MVGLGLTFEDLAHDHRGWCLQGAPNSVSIGRDRRDRRDHLKGKVQSSLDGHNQGLRWDKGPEDPRGSVVGSCQLLDHPLTRLYHEDQGDAEMDEGCPWTAMPAWACLREVEGHVSPRQKHFPGDRHVVPDREAGGLRRSPVHVHHPRDKALQILAELRLEDTVVCRPRGKVLVAPVFSAEDEDHRVRRRDGGTIWRPRGRLASVQAA